MRQGGHVWERVYNIDPLVGGVNVSWDDTPLFVSSS